MIGLRWRRGCLVNLLFLIIYMSKKIFIKFFVPILAAFFILSGCSFYKNNRQSSNSGGKPDASAIQKPTNLTKQLVAQTKIKKFANQDELKEFLEENDLSPVSYLEYEGVADSVSAIESMGVGGMGVAKKEAFAPQTSTMDFSKTNVQVPGIDEADIVKTDGKYIYAIAGSSLFIIDAYPAESAEILCKIEFQSQPQDMYINGNSLAVFGSDNEILSDEIYRNFKRRGSYTFFKVFNISDKKNPKQVRDLDFEGDYSNSRMIGDYVYFFTTNYNYYYLEDEPLLPRILDNGNALASSCSEGIKCFNPDIYYFNIPYSSYNFTTAVAINIADNSKPIAGDVYLLSANQNMYVSADNIYLTYTKYISEYQLSMEILKELVYPKLKDKDKEKIVKIEAVGNFILNEAEKMAKISQILERYKQSLSDEEQEKLAQELEEAMKQKYKDIAKELEKTVIHKIAINNGDLAYKAFGEVSGQVLNQFSMDENNGYFRIATTKNRSWSQFTEEETDSDSNLYVLDENLKQVGALEKLAPGESIYSVRFMQNRAYIVTFKQMDPLFVLDLTDPKAPKVLGELKIPGYSDYLHPYDNETLIGLGKDTGQIEFGGVRAKGLKLSLFDVSDVGSPKEIDTYIIGGAGSDSTALRDHKAFLFAKEKNLLSIPASISEAAGGEYWGSQVFSGAIVFKVDKTGFELKGKISHSDNGQSAESYEGDYYEYGNAVNRSLYINDMLYTFSNKYLKMNNISDLKQVNKIKLFKEKTGGDYKIIN